MTSFDSGQDSISLQIQNAPASQNRLNTSQKKMQRQIIKDYQLKLNPSHNRLDIFFIANQTYLKNLIQRKQRPKLNPNKRSQLGTNCIIYQPFTMNRHQSKQFLSYSQIINGNIHIVYHHQKNVQIKVYFDKEVKRYQDSMWIIFYYSALGVWKSKNCSLTQEDGKFTFTLSTDDFNDIIQPNLLINITIKRKQTPNSNYLGIINLGNTCFMSSVLQMMFYLKPLRKIILQSKSDKKIIHQLRNVFCKLMDIEEKKPIDVEQLLQSYQKYNQLPRQQQDVQQFLFDFINQIQIQCPQAKQLWQGKCCQITESKQRNKPYLSTQYESFTQLDVHMFNTKGTYFESIEDSLNYLLHEEEVEEMIQNDDHGKIKVTKRRTFERLPDVLMVNLKRYQWNKQKLRLSKIFSHIQYKEQLNLGFIIGTPGNEEKNLEASYSLFSVIVHKGTSPNNGHYFVFVNTSSETESPQWVEFNDSMVRLSENQQVLKFTGKKVKQVILDKNLGRFVEKQIETDDSSYLLVYIRKAIFHQFQTVKTRLPQSYIKQKLKKTTQKQRKNIQQVNVLRLNSKKEEINIFDRGLQYMQIPLNKNESLQRQLRKVSKTILGCKVKALFKINIGERNAKRLKQYEMVDSIEAFKRGFSSFDYVLVIGQQFEGLGDKKTEDKGVIKGQGRGGKQEIREGLIEIVRNQMSEQIKKKGKMEQEGLKELGRYELVTVKELQELQSRLVEKGYEMRFLNQKLDFEWGFNSFLQVQIVRNERMRQEMQTVRNERLRSKKKEMIEIDIEEESKRGQ